MKNKRCDRRFLLLFGTCFLSGCDPISPLEQAIELRVTLRTTGEPVSEALISIARAAEPSDSVLACGNLVEPIDSKVTDPNGRVLLQLETICIGGSAYCPENGIDGVTNEAFCVRVELGAMLETLVGTFAEGVSLGDGDYEVRVVAIGRPRGVEAE